MSGISPVKVIDGRQAYEAKKMFPVLEGATQVQLVNFPAQSLNSSNHTYVINIPSRDAITNRVALYHWNGTAELVGTSGSGNLDTQVVVGLSESCADQCISNETVQFGSRSNQVNRSQYGVELNRLNVSYDELTKFLSGSGGSYKDFGISFPAWTNTNRNPLGLVSDVNVGANPLPRTCNIRVVASSATTVTVEFDIWFTSAVSPFLQLNQAIQGLRGLDTITCQLTLENQLIRMFSCNVTAGSTITGLNSFTFNTAEMWIQFLTPSEGAIHNYVPTNDVYSYSELQYWPQTPVNLAQTTDPDNRQSVTLSISQLSGQVIPDKILIGARNVQSMMPLNGALKPRYYYPIIDGGCNLKFITQTVLNNTTVRENYDMSVANGLSFCSYEQFAGLDLTYNQIDSIANGYDSDVNLVGGGGFLVIDPSKQFQISKLGLCNGCLSNFTLSGSVRVANQTYDAQPNIELFIVALYPGYMTVNNGQVTTQIGLIMPEEVRSIFANSEVPINSGVEYLNTKHGYQGGNIFSRALNFIGKHKDKLVSVGKLAYENRDKIKSGLSKARSLIGRGQLDEDDDYTGGASLDTSSRAVASKKSMALQYMNRKS